jgi:hypothetical protein
MRGSIVLAAAILLACVVSAAEAAPAPPTFEPRTSFRTARAELAKAGFVPLRIVSPREGCRGAACDRPRPFGYYRSLGSWRWVFADRTSHALFFVDEVVGMDRHGGYDEFGAMYPAERETLEFFEVELVLPNGVHRRFRRPPPKPPPPDPPTPLCSEVPPHTLPCWIKPPADYGRRR